MLHVIVKFGVKIL